MKKLIFFILALCIFVSLFISMFPVIASTQHGINGFVEDSLKGVSPNDLPVTFGVINQTSQENYCNLSDVVGENGNAKLNNWYAIDIGNCEVQWQAGDIVYIFVGNSTHNASTEVELSEFGNDQAGPTQLSDPYFCGDFDCDIDEDCTSCPEDCPPTCNENDVCEPALCENVSNCEDCICNLNDICEPDLLENCNTCPWDCHCPDGICQPEYNETNETCFEDCPCGNGICDTIIGPCGSYNETYEICPIDCPGCYCGNYICENDCNGENHVNCPSDCNGTCNYNGICEFGEFYSVCPDCPVYCGNMICDIQLGENAQSCPSDCGEPICGDSVCDTAKGENWQNCPTDCYDLMARCGDKVCELAETKENCCVDCGCESKGYRIEECIKNKCTPKCCLFGICYMIYICWYFYALAVIILITLIVFLFIIRKRKIKKKKVEKKKKVLEKVPQIQAKTQTNK